MESLTSGGPNMDTSLQVRIDHRSQMETTLETGIVYLQHTSRRRKLEYGILITRTSPTDFTLEIHPDVPFGTTREKQDW